MIFFFFRVGILRARKDLARLIFVLSLPDPAAAPVLRHGDPAGAVLCLQEAGARPLRGEEEEEGEAQADGGVQGEVRGTTHLGFP